MADDDFIKIRKRDLVRFVFFIFLISVGYFLNDIIKGSPDRINTNTETCKEFCSLASLEYAFVKDGNCYCNQKQIAYNQVKNETVIVFQTVNTGIIKNITTEPGLTQEAMNAIIRQK